MAELKLSEPDRIAVILKKLITPEVRDPGYKHIDSLPFEYRELVHLLLSEGKDKGLRENRLLSELGAKDKAGQADLERIRLADPNNDLDSVELKDTWDFFTLKDAYEPLPPLEWAIDGIIARPSLSMFFGPPKNLKTLLVQDLVICVASGSRWLEGLPGKSSGLKTRPIGALWIDFENGERRMKERFSAFGRARQLGEDTPVWCASMPRPWLDANKLEQIGNLMRRIEHYGANLVVIDHLTQITGDIDENTSGMANIMGNLRSMAEAANLAVILIHHQVKGASRFGISASESLRGHGSILASCDLACVIERNVYAKDQVLIKPVAVRGANVDLLAATFSYEQKADGSRELEKARFWGEMSENLEAEAEGEIERLLAENGEMNATDLKNALIDLVEGVGDSKARAIIGRMKRDGRIDFRKGGKGAKLYFIPDDD